MRSSKHVSTTAVALHRVFVSPYPPALRAPATAAAAAAGPIFQTSNKRCITLVSSSSSLPCCARQTFPAAPPLASTPQRRLYAYKRASSGGRAPRALSSDDAIATRRVRIVDAAGKLGPPVATAVALRSYDAATHTMTALAQPMPGDAEAATIVRIASRQALREQQRGGAGRAGEGGGGGGARGARGSPKTLELNWAIDRHDLGIKLARLRGFLDRGHRVELFMCARKRKRRAGEGEAQELVRAVRAALAEVRGAREVREAEGSVGGTMRMFVQGPAPGRARGGAGAGAGAGAGGGREVDEGSAVLPQAAEEQPSAVASPAAGDEESPSPSPSPSPLALSSSSLSAAATRET